MLFLAGITLSSNILSNKLPEKYHFVLDNKLFEYVSGIGNYFWIFKLLKTNYYLIINSELGKVTWGREIFPYKEASFREVFESVPPEVGTELVFHFDIFL